MLIVCAALLFAANTATLDSAQQAAAPAVPGGLTVPVSQLKTARPRGDGRIPKKGPQGKGGHNHPGGGSIDGVPNVDSLPNFVDSFTAPGFDGDGNPQSLWPYRWSARRQIADSQRSSARQSFLSCSICCFRTAASS